MPAPSTISQKSPLRVARSHLSFTHRNLDANPLTKSHTPPLSALLGEWTTTFQLELDLSDQVDYTTLQVIATDRSLNQIAKRASKELLTITGDNSAHPLYQHYFQGKPLHVFIRPIMGKQLESMRGWIPSLASSDNPTLKALGQELVPLIQQADQTISARTSAEAAFSQFKDIGERSQLINKINAALKSVYGALAAMPHNNPTLPSNFADGFFLRERVKGEVPEEPTVESVEEEIAELSAALDEKQKQLEELKVKREQAEQKQAAKAAAKAKMAHLELEMAEKQKELAALSKELED